MVIVIVSNSNSNSAEYFPGSPHAGLRGCHRMAGAAGTSGEALITRLIEPNVTEYVVLLFKT